MFESPNPDLNPRQLVWRCRRGVRELDVLFGRYLEEQYETLAADQKVAFQVLLVEQDPIIMDWLFDRSAPQNTDLLPTVERLKHLAGL